MSSESETRNTIGELLIIAIGIAVLLCASLYGWVQIVNVARVIF